MLEACAKSLEPGGVLIVRDGVKDLAGQHGMTKMTEFFSTKLFKFNKTTNELHFFDRDFIDTFASKNELSLDYTPPSGRTSNALFVLKRNR